MYSSFVNRGSLLLAPALALCSWTSLNPYFLWGSSRHIALAGLTAGVIAVLAFIAGDRPRKSEMIGFAMMAIFIVYISFLPKTDGSFTRWYFVLPTMLALFVFEDSRRAELIKAFSIIFGLSLLPGVLVSIGAILGLQISFNHRPLLNPVMAAAGGYYLNVPGVLLLGNNVTSLPWGGTLYRLCAVYDEPGMVGTVSAFLLAAHRFRIRSTATILLFVGGLLSFSLAFAVLTVAGFTARLVLTRSATTLAPLALSVVAGLLAAGVIKPDSFHTETNSKGPGVDVTASAPSLIRPLSSPPELVASLPETQASEASVVKNTTVLPASTLRQTQYINNRSLPEMQKLINDYWSSDLKTLMFGVSSDASVTFGGVSQVVTRIFTDFGIIGMILFAGSMILLAIALLRRADLPKWALLFFALFLFSIYQRPIVWMPYAFTLFICCPVLAGVNVRKRISVT
ncbi:hypothetical protein [Pseudomonas sp. GL-B-12]|uniref:hypothetical protein n=1 Tax=Pseudomonas sp. GL-B-12 TaxID=2832374 RepID=UPI001CBCB2D3|nr:hypothetical protein [Pseudomonas sp. GL-B-12]